MHCNDIDLKINIYCCPIYGNVTVLGSMALLLLLGQLHNISTQVTTEDDNLVVKRRLVVLLYTHLNSL